MTSKRYRPRLRRRRDGGDDRQDDARGQPQRLNQIAASDSLRWHAGRAPRLEQVKRRELVQRAPGVVLVDGGPQLVRELAGDLRGCCHTVALLPRQRRRLVEAMRLVPLAFVDQHFGRERAHHRPLLPAPRERLLPGLGSPRE